MLGELAERINAQGFGRRFAKGEAHRFGEGRGCGVTGGEQASLSQLRDRAERVVNEKACVFSFHCGRCSEDSPLGSLSADAKGHLRPVRCKHCGHAARPNNARCLECSSGWQACRSRPAALQTSKAVQGALGAKSWCLSFATDFTGMDMTACALDSTLLGHIAVSQAWGSDIWDQARNSAIGITGLSACTAMSKPRTSRDPRFTFT
jgi:hypothetical protein